ncbi:MAG: sulfatase-like hydrolase/transferase, partial [Deltaproteobacteria bacterium]
MPRRSEDRGQRAAGRRARARRLRLALAAFLLVACSPGPERPGPNLVLIIGDDHGYRDFGFMGSEIVQTPTLDRLAREGTVFRNAQVTASVCAPSLRTLLTGLYPYQWNLRMEQLATRGYPRPAGARIEAFETLPARLADVGYVSFQAGKFHEPSHAVAGFTHGMERPRRGDSPIGR